MAGSAGEAAEGVVQPAKQVQEFGSASCSQRRDDDDCFYYFQK